MAGGDVDDDRPDVLEPVGRRHVRRTRAMGADLSRRRRVRSGASTHAPLGFYQAMHLVGFPAKVLMLEAVLNLGLSIWLAPRLGITGVALATALPALLMSAVVLPPYLCRQLGVPVRTFLMRASLPGGLMFVANAVASMFPGWLSRPTPIPRSLPCGNQHPCCSARFPGDIPRDERRALWNLSSWFRRMAPRSPKVNRTAADP